MRYSNEQASVDLRVGREFFEHFDRDFTSQHTFFHHALALLPGLGEECFCFRCAVTLINTSLLTLVLRKIVMLSTTPAGRVLVRLQIQLHLRLCASNLLLLDFQHYDRGLTSTRQI